MPETNIRTTSNGMRIYYVANARIPTEKAHGIQIMSMCEAFADLGHQVTLLVPRRENPIAEDPFVFYGVKKNFQIERVFSLDLINKKYLSYRFGFFIQQLSFSIAAFFKLLFVQAGIYYGRDVFALALLSLFRKTVVYEAHSGSFTAAHRVLKYRAKAWIVITNQLKTFFVSKGVREKKILVAHDGVNLALFTGATTKEEARVRLQIPQDKKLIVYTGHLYDWKGVYTLGEAAEELDPESLVLFVGGTLFDMPAFKKRFDYVQTISIVGQRPYHEIPLYLKAADILVLPNSSKQKISRLYTSPLKLFEYMASDRPIVASDLPSLREILTEESALFVPPDDPKALATAIELLLANPKRGAQLALAAREKAQLHDWSARAMTILNFIVPSIL